MAGVRVVLPSWRGSGGVVLESLGGWATQEHRVERLSTKLSVVRKAEDAWDQLPARQWRRLSGRTWGVWAQQRQANCTPQGARDSQGSLCAPVCLAAQPCLTLKVPLMNLIFCHVNLWEICHKWPQQWDSSELWLDTQTPDKLSFSPVQMQPSVSLPRSAPIYASCPSVINNSNKITFAINRVPAWIGNNAISLTEHSINGQERKQRRFRRNRASWGSGVWFWNALKQRELK